LLLEILGQKKPAKALIFTATREATSEVALVLRRRRHDVVSLSSQLSQANRERALQAFRSGECPILVATDVAARGLDITDIDLVVNFDVPGQAEDYVHRIGRTGRAARTGSAVTLVAEDDERRAGDIDRLLGEKVPRIEVEGFDYKPRSLSRGRPGRGGGRGSGGGRRGASRPGSDRRGSGRGGRRKAGSRRSNTRKDPK
jgi:ATP-dependent RNA helicase RhlE